MNWQARPQRPGSAVRETPQSVQSARCGAGLKVGERFKAALAVSGLAIVRERTALGEGFRR